MNMYALMNTTAYKPRQAKSNNSLMIGHDIMPIRQSSKPETERRTISIEDSVDVSNAAKGRYMQGRSGHVQFEQGSWNISVEASGTRNGLNVMTLTDKLTGQTHKFEFRGDAKLDLSDPGAPKLLTGKDALTNGKLVATGDKTVLLRASADVEGGSGKSTVVGLSNEAGTFVSGVGGTRYLGRFDAASIQGSGGADAYEGTFTDSKITGGDGLNEFSGNFFNSVVEGGSTQDVFSGLFLGNSKLNGNAGDDEFTGSFFDSEVNGGEGNDRYGKMTLHAVDRGNFSGYGVDVGFWGAKIVDESGDNTMEAVLKESTAEFSNGNNTISGAFVDSSVDAGGGDNLVRAFFAENSNFVAGAGNDTIQVATGLNNNMSAGEGDNEVGLGAADGGAGWGMTIEGGGFVSMAGKRWGRDVIRDLDVESQAFGHQQGNFVDVGEGNDTINITIGDITKTIVSAKKIEKEEGTKEDLRPHSEIEAEDALMKGAQALAGSSANQQHAGKTELAPGETIDPYQQKDANRLMGLDAVRPKAEKEDETFTGPAGKTLEDKVGALYQKANDLGVDRIDDGVTLGFADGTVEAFEASEFKATRFDWATTGRQQIEPGQSVLRAAIKAYTGA